MDKYLGYLGKRVRQLREEFGWSQTALADEMARFGIKMTQGGIGHIETGYRKPGLDTLIALSFTLQASCDYLLGITDDQSPPEPRMVSDTQRELERIFNLLSPARQHEVLVIAKALADDQPEPSTDSFEQVINATLDLLTEIDPVMYDKLLSRLNADAMPIARRLILNRQRSEEGV